VPNDKLHVYEVRPRKDHRDNRSDFRLREVSQPITDAVIRGYDETGNVIETREHKGDSRSALAI